MWQRSQWKKERGEVAEVRARRKIGSQRKQEKEDRSQHNRWAKQGLGRRGFEKGERRKTRPERIAPEVKGRRKEPRKAGRTKAGNHPC